MASGGAQQGEAARGIGTRNNVPTSSRVLRSLGLLSPCAPAPRPPVQVAPAVAPSVASSRSDHNLQKHVELTMEVEAIRREKRTAAAGRVGVPLPDERPRGDVPVVKQRRRGEFLLTHQDLTVMRKDRMMENYQREKYAASSASSRESHLRTWTAMLHAWHGAPVNPIPVEPEDIGVVGCLMKECEYRSFAQYVSRLRELHIRMGFTWTPQHALEAQAGIRSVTRGQGPARQSAPVAVDALRGLGAPADPLATGGFVGPIDAIILGAAFVLREIELAAARYRHMTVDHAARTVTLELPVSKTDVCGIGCARNWGCVCLHGQPGVDSVMACPFHAAVRHDALLRARFGGGLPGGQPDAWSPLFPTAAGTTPSKDAVVRSIEAVAALLGEPLFEADGTRRYGGHSMRVSGARWLAAKGVAAEKIAALARWESAIVLRYIGDSALADLTAQCVRLTQARGAALPEVRVDDYAVVRDEALARFKLQGDTGDPDEPSILSEYQGLKDMIQSVAGEVDALKLQDRDRGASIEGVRRQLEALHVRHAESPAATLPGPGPDQHRFVLNARTAMLHEAQPHLDLTASDGWMTICSWRFAGARSSGYRFLRSPRHPLVERTCTKCGLPPLPVLLLDDPPAEHNSGELGRTP